MPSSTRVHVISILCAALAACAPRGSASPAPPRTGDGAAPIAPEPAADPAARPAADPAAGPAPAAAPATPIADRYRDVARAITEAALRDRGAWDKLAYLTDRVGARLSGSPALERAIAWAAETMVADGHDSVRAEKVMVPHWVRGAESAEILAPSPRPLAILGLGGTVGTGPRGVTGQVVVVDSFERIEQMAAADPRAFRGKIILYDTPMADRGRDAGDAYGDTVKYRGRGADVGASVGARAVLVRSLTTRSLRTPHTGGLRYADPARRIPAASVATEDADLIARLDAAGQPVTVKLVLGARQLPDAESANVIGELRGSERPDEIVVVGAHIDSWDVGQGAHDDGTGCALAMQTLTLLRQLGLRPRRTIRAVLFTNEENGLRGGRAYAREHAAEMANHVMALESDTGGFAPRGFNVRGTEQALAHMRDIITLVAPVGAAETQVGYPGADILPMAEHGVNLLGHWVDETHYFDYHHTAADTLDKVSPEDLARNLAAIATVVYVIADMPERFGGEPAPAPAPAGP